MTIGGKAVDATVRPHLRVAEPLHGQAVGASCPTADPRTSTPRWPRRGRRSRASGGPSSPGSRGRPCCAGSGDLVTENAERLARLEVNDSGKLYREMIGQLNGLGAWYHYYAGLADKIEGRQIPSAEPELPRLHPARAGRRGRGDHAVELAAAADDLEARPGARGRLHGRGQAVGARAGVHARASSSWSSRPASRRAWSTSSPGSPGRWGPRSPRTPAWTRSRSPGRRPPAGRSPQAAAENINKVTLELGGKSPQIVFPDADLAGRGQRRDRRRVRRHRPDLHGRVAADRARRRPRRAGAASSPSARRRIRLGDPNDPGTEMGPVANRAAVREGARLPRDRPGRGRHGRLRRRRRRGARRAVRPADRAHRRHAATPRSCARRCSVRCSRRSRSPTRTRRSSSPTTPRTASPARSGPRTCTARTGSPRRLRAGHRLDQRLPRRRAERAVRRVRRQRARPGERRAPVDEYLENKSVWVELTGGTRDPFTLG